MRNDGMLPLAGDVDLIRNGKRPLEAERSVFRTFVCGSSLRVFTDPLGNTAENQPESQLNDALSQFFGNPSVEVPG